MIQVMADNKGVGLAAPQVGLSQRLFIMRLDDGTIEMCVNPQIKALSPDTVQSTEGCLSHPGLEVTTRRHREITVAYYTMDGGFVLRSMRDLEAIIFQHEMDHLNGVTIVNKIPR